jgi:heme-degrading monooxygenase HmoA
MIARIWRGSTSPEDADAYLLYLRSTGISAYEKTPGNEGVFVFRSIADGKAHFLLISLWVTLESIRAFAGDDIDHAVFYPEDERYLIDGEDRVRHFELVSVSGRLDFERDGTSPPP